MAETNEASNCLATPTAAVTVTRPDLVENSVSAPPATKARGTAFTVTDTVLNGGAVASGVTTTRYYLSLDAVRGTGDTLLSGSRTVPGPGGRRNAFRHGDGDHPGRHTAQHVLPARLCRRCEVRRGDRRGEQLQGIQHDGDRHALIGHPVSVTA